MTFKIYNAQIVTINSQNQIIEKGFVEIENDTIKNIAIGVPKEINLEDYNANGQILMPGFVNTHTHLPMTIFRGIADDLPLQTWLEDYIWPAEKKFLNPKSIAIGSKLGILELIKSGTTTFNDMYFFSSVIAPIAANSGIRAVTSESIIGFPTKTFQNTEEALAINADFIAQYKNHPNVHPTISVHAPYSCSTKTLVDAKEFANKHQLFYNIHISETQQEVNDIKAKYGAPPVEYLNNIGVLDHKTMGAHCVWFNQNETEIYAERGAHVSHNPTSNLKLGCGFAPIPAYLKNNINVALGTDGAASNSSVDLMEEIRLAALIHKGNTQNPEVVNAQTALRMATINGAKALGLDHKIGSVEINKKADLILIDLNQPATTPIYNVNSALVYSAHSNQITGSLVNGKWLMKDQLVLALNAQDALCEAKELAKMIKANFKK